MRARRGGPGVLCAHPDAGMLLQLFCCKYSNELLAAAGVSARPRRGSCHGIWPQTNQVPMFRCLQLDVTLTSS